MTFNIITNRPKPAIVTLHSDAASVLTAPVDKIAYLIKFMFLNPGNVTELNNTISFRMLQAQYGLNRTELANAVQKELQRSIDENVDIFNTNVTVTSTAADAQGRYGLSVEIRDTNGVLIMPINKIRVEDDNVIDINYASGG
jgi:CRP-like cAMP-binding protein